MRRTLICLAGLAALAFATAAGATDKKAPAKTPGKELKIVSDIEKRVAQFAPTPLHADVSGLTAEDRKVLDKLVQAAKLMNEIFLRQAWTGNPAMREQLKSYAGPHAAAVREYFDINFGPWDRLAEREPFLGDKPHPKGAGYYPEDLTKEAFDDWVAKHPAGKDKLTSTVTVIRRTPNGGLVTVPYSHEYAEWLKPAAKLLREAAALTHNASLKRFLTLRAGAFESDDYYASDVAWMDLDAPVEVTIGPYETYEDDLFGYKAAFESFVTVNLPKESAALTRYKERLPWLEKNLPIPDADKNLHRGTDSPIRVVDTYYSSGDNRAGVQTVAFNLPNDERVREAKGSKKVLLHNMMRAKYDKILIPIAHQVLDPAQVKDVSFDAYFNEVLHHELSHGLGPGTITVNGRKTEVRLELKELFSTLEEAKADVMGVYNILALIDQKEMPASLRHSLEPTYVAGLFRSARFGVDEAHGQGVVAQFNYLAKKGALVTDAQGRVHAVSEKFPGAIRDLLHDMLTLQARGDYNGTKQFLDTYGKPTQALRDALGRLKSVPVDIKPVYGADK
ncbi:MAG: dipeptidyl-peptidase 3 family protein [Thermoanaerobaculia bacterium]